MYVYTSWYKRYELVVLTSRSIQGRLSPATTGHPGHRLGGRGEGRGPELGDPTTGSRLVAASCPVINTTVNRYIKADTLRPPAAPSPTAPHPTRYRSIIRLTIFGSRAPRTLIAHTPRTLIPHSAHSLFIY